MSKVIENLLMLTQLTLVVAGVLYLGKTWRRALIGVIHNPRCFLSRANFLHLFLIHFHYKSVLVFF